MSRDGYLDDLWDYWADRPAEAIVASGAPVRFYRTYRIFFFSFRRRVA